MAAQYIYRMDDITPAMDWKKFNSFIEIFRRSGVVPLLGIVPDNRDPKLTVDKENIDFWKEMRMLQKSGTVEFAQHGYQHLYDSFEYGMFGEKYGFKKQSEFSGLSFDLQFEKIVKGRAILQREGIVTDVFMAPAHSFDCSTLQALAKAGFSSVTDGIGLYPETIDSIVLVPQQIAIPRYFPFGFITVCIHSNNTTPRMIEQFEQHLSRHAQSVKFSDAASHRSTKAEQSLNAVFRYSYLTARVLKKYIR